MNCYFHVLHPQNVTTFKSGLTKVYNIFTHSVFTVCHIGPTPDEPWTHCGGHDDVTIMMTSWWWWCSWWWCHDDGGTEMAWKTFHQLEEEIVLHVKCSGLHAFMVFRLWLFSGLTGNHGNISSRGFFSRSGQITFEDPFKLNHVKVSHLMWEHGDVWLVLHPELFSDPIRL